jgi:hypothetical protein
MKKTRRGIKREFASRQKGQPVDFVKRLTA